VEKPRWLVIASLLLAGDALASTGAALLFAKDAGGLAEKEQAAIFAGLGLGVAADGKGFVDDVCGQPAGAQVEFRDMNGDGAKEVLVTYGNTCLSGHAGSSVVLFVKDASGAYRANLGFPGASADPMATKNRGYPDLLIGGPGFCFPVWRWNGTEYAHHRQEAQEPGGCDELGK